MAVKLHHGGDELEVNHEINVTPFIDVILVLLIIFMVVAPLATVDVAVDLPVSTAQTQMRPYKPIFLTIKADRGLSLGDAAVPPDGLAAALDLASGGDKEQRVFLRADKSIDYDTLMRTLNVLRGAGYLKVALMGLDQGSGP